MWAGLGVLVSAAPVVFSKEITTRRRENCGTCGTVLFLNNCAYYRLTKISSIVSPGRPWDWRKAHLMTSIRACEDDKHDSSTLYQADAWSTWTRPEFLEWLSISVFCSTSIQSSRCFCVWLFWSFASFTYSCVYRLCLCPPGLRVMGMAM